MVDLRYSLRQRLIGSEGMLFSVQGQVPEGSRVIVPGVYISMDKGYTTETFRPLYRYTKPEQNRTHSIPNVMRKDDPNPSPLVNFSPVQEWYQTTVQLRLERMGFDDYTRKFHFWPEKRSSRIDPINHRGIPDFEQLVVKRINLGTWKDEKIWERKKEKKVKPYNPKDLGPLFAHETL
jgi:hypothetical protein